MRISRTRPELAQRAFDLALAAVAGLERQSLAQVRDGVVVAAERAHHGMLTGVRMHARASSQQAHSHRVWMTTTFFRYAKHCALGVSASVLNPATCESRSLAERFFAFDDVLVRAMIIMLSQPHEVAYDDGRLGNLRAGF